MAEITSDQVIPDQVQVFDATEAMKAVATPEGQSEMASSPNCEILVLSAPPKGKIEIPSEKNADTIVLVLKGAAEVEGPSGRRTLSPEQGVLVPSGMSCTLHSVGEQDLSILSLRSDSAESRPGYLPNTGSGVMVRVPNPDEPFYTGRRIYLFALDHRTIRASPKATQEWNAAAFLRMHCDFEKVGEDVLLDLPERLVRWYGARQLSEHDYRIVPEAADSVLIDLSPFVEREAAIYLASQTSP
jgi:hypothetical protein